MPEELQYRFLSPRTGDSLCMCLQGTPQSTHLPSLVLRFTEPQKTFRISLMMDGSKKRSLISLNKISQ